MYISPFSNARYKVAQSRSVSHFPRREPRLCPPPVGMITSLSRFITFHPRPQKRRKCARELGRSAPAGRNIDLVQIQRLLLQTDEDLREASLRPPRNKCGTITQTAASHTQNYSSPSAAVIVKQ